MTAPILEDPQLQTAQAQAGPDGRRIVLRYAMGLAVRALGYTLLWRWFEPGGWGRIVVAVFMAGEVLGLAWAAFTVIVIRKMVSKLQQAAALASERIEQGQANRAADRDAIVVEPTSPGAARTAVPNLRSLASNTEQS